MAHVLCAYDSDKPPMKNPQEPQLLLQQSCLLAPSISFKLVPSEASRAKYWFLSLQLD